ncbi:MAG: ABC transporter substrate-binding protein [Chloroflexi bacterium]|nr:ABC transporter substrate-binding protein [Chloroflexota bacterium]
MKRLHKVFAISAAAATLLAACGGAKPAAPAATGPKTKVKLVLQWVVQSQFAGYFAAKDKGFYAAEGLDVEIIPGGPDVSNSQYVASGQADIGVGWTPGKILAPREQGAKLVNIAQIFQRSGTLMISFKDKNVTKVADFADKNIGSWLGGNEPELFAAMIKDGIEPDKGAKIIQQGFDMNQMLKGEIDVAQAMIYNEYAQVLESKNPATGQLYKPEELNVINFNDVGTAMLQDAVLAKEEWLADAKNQETAVKFLRATYKGWMFCRDNLDECVQIVLKNGSALGESHMKWQLNEINALIWPSPNGVGVLDEAAYKQTVEIAKTYGVLKAEPDAAAMRTDLAKKALEGIDGDTKGTNFKKATVELKEGGK